MVYVTCWLGPMPIKYISFYDFIFSYNQVLTWSFVNIIFTQKWLALHESQVFWAILKGVLAKKECLNFLLFGRLLTIFPFSEY